MWWCAQGKCCPRGHKGFKGSPMLGNRALTVAKAVLGDAGYIAGYSSSSAATFRRLNPYFTLTVLFPVQDTLQSYLLEYSPALAYICSAEREANSIYFAPYLLSAPFLTHSSLEK